MGARALISTESDNCILRQTRELGGVFTDGVEPSRAVQPGAINPKSGDPTKTMVLGIMIDGWSWGTSLIQW